MKSSKNMQAKPQLRFLGFFGMWTQYKLGEITKKKNNKNKSGKKYPIYSINNVRGFLPQSEQFDGLDSNERNYDTSMYKVVKRNTFAYNPARINVGSIGFSGDLDNVIISSLYVCFSTTDNVDDIFMYHFFKSDLFNRFVKRYVEGGVRQYLFYENFSSIKVNIPTIDEQKKLASFLSTINGWIINLEKQKDTLEEYKKGMTQKIFTKELRFNGKDSKKYPDWEMRKLKDIFLRKTKKNTNNKINHVLTNSASEGIVSQNDYFDRDIVNQNNLMNYYVVEIDDFVYNPRISTSAPVGPMKMNSLQTGVMSPLYTVLELKKGNKYFYEKYFDTSLWHKYMKKVANYGARHDRMAISTSDLMDMPIPYPSEEEQAKIVDFVSSIDQLIELKVNQIKEAKEWKKGLLQQMFV